MLGGRDPVRVERLRGLGVGLAAPRGDEPLGERVAVQAAPRPRRTRSPAPTPAPTRRGPRPRRDRAAAESRAAPARPVVPAGIAARGDRRLDRLERVATDEQAPDLLERPYADRVLDVDAAIAQRVAFTVGFGDLGLERDDPFKSSCSHGLIMPSSSILTESMLTTSEAARRLGVKPETLYAYVSRGQLTRHPAAGRPPLPVRPRRSRAPRGPLPPRRPRRRPRARRRHGTHAARPGGSPVLPRRGRNTPRPRVDLRGGRRAPVGRGERGGERRAERAAASGGASARPARAAEAAASAPARGSAARRRIASVAPSGARPADRVRVILRARGRRGPAPRRPSPGRRAAHGARTDRRARGLAPAAQRAA